MQFISLVMAFGAIATAAASPASSTLERRAGGLFACNAPDFSNSEGCILLHPEIGQCGELGPSSPRFPSNSIPQRCFHQASSVPSAVSAPTVTLSAHSMSKTPHPIHESSILARFQRRSLSGQRGAPLPCGFAWIQQVA